MEFLAHRIADKRILRYIKRFLKAGICEDRIFRASDRGTPQGGLCKALHKPPYAKFTIMQSKSLMVQNFITSA